MTDRAIFNHALQSFYEGCQRIAEENRTKHYPKSTPAKWELQWLQKRVRVVRDSGAYAFVDMATGDVLMPASWTTPTKHARGNIYDEHNGLGSMGPYGPAYMR